jgi:quercetin dioxygenase-like cupin family protein
MLVVRTAAQTLEDWRPGVVTRRIVSAVSGAETLCVLEQRHQPGRGAPTHWHDIEEIVLVLEGRAEFHSGESRELLETGDAIVFPAGERHGFVNVGEEPLRILAAFSSAAPSVTYEEEAGVELEIGSAEAVHRTPRDTPLD